MINIKLTKEDLAKLIKEKTIEVKAIVGFDYQYVKITFVDEIKL